MSNNKNTENEDYQFIRETLVNKKKNRMKRWILSTLAVLALAVVFGFVARVVFITSEGLAFAVLGITPTATPPEVTKAPVSIAPATQKPTVTPTNTPSPSPVTSPTEEAEPSPTPTPSPIPTPVIDAGISSIVSAYEEIRQVAAKASKYLAKVEVVTITTDWFGDEIEDSKVTSGLVLGDNSVELLVLVSYARVATANRIDVTLAGKTVKNVEVLTVNEEYGMAILKLELSNFTEAELKTISYASLGNSDTLGVGVPLVAVGSPNGYFGAFEFAVINSQAENAYVCDNSFSVYNTVLPETESGDGFLVNFDGEVVGIITHDFKDSLNANKTSFISINECKYMIGNLANGEKWNYLGLVAKEAPAGILSTLKISNGLYITEVQADSPAEAAGLKKGDILVSLAGQEVPTAAELNVKLNLLKQGETVTVDIIRGNERKSNIPITIGAK